MATFNIDVVVSNRGAVTGVQAVDRQLGLLNRTVSSLQNAFVGLFAIQEIGRFVTSVGRVAESFNRLERSAQIAAGPTGDVAFAFDSVVNTADRAGAALTTTSNIFQRFSLATRAAGVSQQEVATITDTLVRGFTIFTGSAAEANSAITQLSQAFSSGRLAGDEFRSVSENFPPLLQAISDVTGVATQDLRDFAAEGNITSDVLLEAFRRLEDQISDLEATIDQTLDQSLNRLSNSFIILVGEIDNATGITGLFRDAVNSLTGVLTDTRLLAFGGTVQETRDALIVALAAQEEYNAEVENSGFVSNLLSLSLVRQVGLQDQVRAATANHTIALNAQNEATQQVADTTQLFEAAQAQLIATVTQFNTIQQLSTQEFLRQVDVGGDLTDSINRQIDAKVSQIQVDEQAIRLLQDGVQVQETLNNLLSTSADEQRAGLALDAQVAAEITRRNTLIEAQNALLEEQRQAIENVTATFAEFLNLDTSSLENAFANLATLGVDLAGVFEGASASVAAALGVTETEVTNATSGIFAILNQLGIDVEDIFGSRITGAIQLLGAVTSEEFQGITAVLGGAASTIGELFGFGGGGGGDGGGGGGFFGGIVDGISSLFGGAGASVETFANSSFATFTSFNSSIGDLQSATSDATGAVGGLGDAIGATDAAAGASVANIAASAAAAAGLAATISSVAGFSDETTIGASVGAGAGAVLGSIVPGIGTAIGAIGGGLLGGAIGSLFGDDEEDLALEVGRDIANAVLRGAVIPAGQLFSELNQDNATAAFDRIELVVGRLNENLRGSTQELQGFFGAVQTGAVGTQEFLLALSNAPLTAAAEISDAFNLTVTDVAAIFNTLPRELAGTFELISQNSGEIADILVEQFGLSREEVVAVLEALAVDAQGAFAQIEEASRFVSANLAQEFGVSVIEVARLFDDLPEGVLENFFDIATNAEDIARRIAVSFGLTFDEALAFVNQFAADAGVSLSDVGTTAQDVAQTIVDGFSGRQDQLNTIFFELARQGVDALENIRLGADGTFEFVDASAQEALENIVARFGGSEDDIQLILGTLAGNADISFGDILASGLFAFDNLDEGAQEFARNLLAELGFSAEQIEGFLTGVSNTGEEAFAQLESDASVTLTNILSAFGLTQAQITPILGAISDDGDASFSTLEGASEEALRAILTEFGITESQIAFIFRNIELGAEGAFTGIRDNGEAAFGALEGEAQVTLSNILSAFGLTQAQITPILAAISEDGDAAFSSIEGASAEALTAILTEFGITESQIAFIFRNIELGAEGAFTGIGQAGSEAFNGLEQDAAFTLNNILSAFGLTQNQIVPILAAIAADGDATFSSIEGASAAALSAILTEFGITESQIAFIFRNIELGAEGAFTGIEGDGEQTASGLEGDFGAAVQFILGIFGQLGSQAGAQFAGISGSAVSSSNVIRSSFSSAAASAAGSLGQIRTAAASANAALSSVAARRASLDAARFADGGIISGPVSLDGGGAGRAFQTGGILNGLTNIFGGGSSVTPTSQLGIAGEAGVEAILPLDRIGGRLGVTASLPESLLEAIRGEGSGRGGTTVIRENRIFILRNASNADLDRIEEQILDVDASIESRSEAVTSAILDEVLS